MAFNLKKLMEGFKEEFRKTSMTNKVSEEDFEKIWSKVTERVENEPPPRVAFIGNTGVGKSSTLNALFNAGQNISHTRACTQEEASIEIFAETVEGEKGALVVYDMPGLDESITSQRKHLETYERVLKDVDVAIWVLEAANRGIMSVQERLIKDIRRINPKLVNRVVFALNKVDAVKPDNSWNTLMNLPSDEQELNIKERINDVEEKIKEVLPTWKGRIVGYSAEKRYNLTRLFSVMLDAVPEERQWVVASRKALSDYLDLVDERLLPEEIRERRAKIKKEKSTKKQNDILKILETMNPNELEEFMENNNSILSKLINKKNK